MKLPRVRFTVRRMMVAVAVVAVALTLDTMRNRAFTFRRIAEKHAWREDAFRSGARAILDYQRRLRIGELGEFEPRPVHPDKPNMSFDEMAEDSEQRAGYYARLVAKYRRAARHPWLPVAPDPPEPE